MRRLALALALLLSGCGSATHYQGDVLLGTFTFDGPRVDAGLCPFDTIDGGSLAPSHLPFTGVFSLDSTTDTLYLTVSGDSRSTHLQGVSYDMPGSADRVICGPAHVAESFKATFWGPPKPALLDGGCATLRGPGSFPDGGLDLLDGGPSTCFAPVGVNGLVADTFVAASQDGGLCAPPADAGSGQVSCTTYYAVTGARQ